MRFGRRAALALLLAGIAQPAQATICTLVQDALAHVVEGKAQTPPFPGTGPCAIVSSPASAVCRWDYPYRSPNARQSFDRLHADLKACFPETLAQTQDVPVNHPDTSRAEVLTTRAATFRLALKDKAELGGSFVFLQMTPAAR